MSVIAVAFGVDSATNAGVDVDLRKLLLKESDFHDGFSEGGINTFEDPGGNLGRLTALIAMFPRELSAVVSVALEAEKPISGSELRKACHSIGSSPTDGGLMIENYSVMDSSALGGNACGFSLVLDLSGMASERGMELADPTFELAGFWFAEAGRVGGVISLHPGGGAPVDTAELTRLAGVAQDRFSELRLIRDLHHKF